MVFFKKMCPQPPVRFFFLEQPNEIHQISGYLHQIGIYIVGTPPPLLKEGGVGTSKNSLTWGVQNSLLERRDKPEKGGWCRNGGLPLFITLQFNNIYFMSGESKVSFITFFSSVLWVSHARFSSKSLVLKHCIDCFIKVSLEYSENYKDKSFWVPRQDVS